MTIEEIRILNRWLQRDSNLKCQKSRKSRTRKAVLPQYDCTVFAAAKPDRFKFYSRFILATQTYNYDSQVSIGAWNYMDHFRTELYVVFTQTGSRVW